MLKSAAIGLVLVVLAMPATALDFQKGLAAYNRGDFVTALGEFRPLAAKGDAEAQHKLGFMYAHGRGVPQDYVEAVKWCRKAAEQENVEAQYRVGLRYSQGQGVPKNIVQAYMWWSLAASEGHQNAGGSGIVLPGT